MTYDAMDVVVVPFPFSDKSATKRRPAILLTPYEAFGKQTGVAQLAMVTAATNSSWPFDVTICDFEASGLKKPCLMRMKIATMGYARIEKRIGRLSERDQKAVRKQLGELFELL